MHTWYYLDANNNKKDPPGLYCERCKRSIKETQSFETFSPIIFHPVNPWFRIAGAFEKSDGLIGSRCLSRVKKEYGEKHD